MSPAQPSPADSDVENHSFRADENCPFRAMKIVDSELKTIKNCHPPRNRYFHQFGMIIFMARNPQLGK